MSGFLERLRRAHASDDLAALLEAIPYARFLRMSLEVREGNLVCKMAYSDHLIGNPLVPALHGGTVGALLESAAIFTLLWRAESEAVPKTINITVDYLRTGHPRDTFASAEVFKQGRRVANVRAVAWQDDPSRPIAAAHAHFLVVPGR